MEKEIILILKSYDILRYELAFLMLEIWLIKNERKLKI